MTRRALAAAALLLLAAGPGGADGPATLEPRADGVRVEGDVRLAPGTWRVGDRDDVGVLRVVADGVTVDLGGATLDGAEPTTPRETLHGVGILVEGARNVTIRGGRVTGFRVGVRAVDAPGLVVEDVDASGCFRQRLGSTPAREDASDWLWPHENDAGEWEARYGAGISLSDTEGATVRRCRVRHGQNGLLLTRCRDVMVYDNDFSFDSGWGVALYRTCTSTVSHNRLDFCVRGYSDGVYHRGQDSAAILVFEQSSGNCFAHNSATHSGDGFFLYAGHETTQRTGEGGSNRNCVIANDFRFAVANGIEATFSDANRFALNDCSGSDHGIWAGYSYRSLFVENRARDCLTAGISVEHGHDNVYARNELVGARYGLHLWWDEDPDLVGGVYGRARDCASARNIISGNVLRGRDADLLLDGDVESELVANELPSPRARIELRGAMRPGPWRANRIADVLVLANRTGGEVEVEDPAPPGGLVLEGDAVRLRPPPTGPLAPPPSTPVVSWVPGTQDVTLPPDLPVGRASIRIDDQGPVDPRETRLFPADQAAAGRTAEVHLLGAGPYRVRAASPGVTVTPASGRAPATLRVVAADTGPALRSFRVEVEAGGTVLAATGTLLVVDWEVAHVAWGPDEHPLEHPEAFRALLQRAAAHAERRAALDEPWRAAGPEGLAPDGFGTIARAAVALPAGAYRLRVVSDDGVRVRVDGEVVLERWDRHGPTEDVADLDLPAGTHAIEVEHFELDGWAWLSVSLGPRAP